MLVVGVKRGGYLQRRTPLKAKKVTLKRAPLRKVGKKGRRDRDELAAVRPLMETRSKGRCEARTDVCTGRGTQDHHLLRRSQGGKHTADNLLRVCGECHDWIHGHPAQAFALGLLRSSSVRRAS